MDENVPKKAAYLTPPLPLVEETVALDKTSTDVIEFQLKQRAGTTGANAATYKMKVSRFQEGSVGDWIAVRKAISELWTQNSIIRPEDKVANIHAILREDSLTAFQAAVQELTHVTDDTGNVTVVVLSDAIVMAGLNAVALTVFPHRALMLQKTWMRRGMKKPRELSFRKTVAAVGKLNNCLPLSLTDEIRTSLVLRRS